MTKFQYSQRYDPRSLGCRCDECPLKEKVSQNRVVVPPHVISPSNKRLVILGESPGATEEVKDNFFTGESGELQDKLLEKNNIPKESVHITNVLLCRMGKLSPDETSKAIECCSARLHREISPNSIVLAYGNIALEALTGKKPKISKHWGPSYKSETYGCQYVSSFHPAYILRNPHAKVLLDLMITRWILLSNGKLHFDWGKQIVEPGAEMEAALRQMLALPSTSPIGLDNEYIGSSSMTADIICIGLANADLNVAVCVPWMTTTDGADTIPEASGTIKNLVAAVVDKSLIYAHNLQADYLSVKYKSGLPKSILHYEKWGDTMLMRRRIAPLLPKNLEDTFLTYRPADRWKSNFRGSQEKGGGNLFAVANPYKRAIYNCKDSKAGVLLADYLARGLYKVTKGWEKYREDLEQTHHAMEMQEHGQGVNLRNVYKHAEDFEGKITKAKAKIASIAGESFNPASNLQIHETFSALGATSKKRTPAGGYSYDEDVLTDIVSKSHSEQAALLASSILGLRKQEKLAQYVRGGAKKKGKIIPLISLLPKMGQANGQYSVWPYENGDILRLNWLPYGTITDRWSTDGFPLMMIPQPKKAQDGSERPGLWDCFEATIPGNELVAADYSAVELRAIAECAQDEVLLEGFDKYDRGIGPKIHTVNACSLFGVTDPTTNQYTLAKNFVFGSLYQLHSDRNASRAVWAILVPDFPNISLADVERLRRDWFKAHPKLAIYQDKLIAEAEATQRIIAPMSGVEFQFHGKIEPNKILNYPIQNTQAEIMRRGISRIRKLLKEGEYLWGQVHDELILEGPKPKRLVELMKEEMPRPQMINGRMVRWPVEVKVGRNKGNMKKVA